MSFLWYWPDGGWTFDDWKARRSWAEVQSQQSGNPKLLPLVSESETLAGWEREKKYWRGVSDEVLGKLTDAPPASPGWEELGGRFDGGSFTMQRGRYRLTPDEWGYAWLLVPKDSPARRAPAVIALHQTTPAGKHEAVGLELRPGGEYLAYGRELAERGFVVLAPDAIAFGERMGESGAAKYHSANDFFAAHPDGSVMGKMMFDTSRAVDLLQSLHFVAGDRIGCIGHSHGGYGTLFAMLADERIKAGAVSCGVTLLRADPTPQRWWRKTALIPRLGYWEGKIEGAPIDFHQWMALLAPRALYVSVGLKDSIFPNTQPLRAAIDEVRKVYKLYGREAAIHGQFFDGPHSFPEENRRASYEMLASELKG